MTAQDRTEVREMLHDILSGWEAATVAREEVTNISLININQHSKNIDEHLKQINGTIAKHSEAIHDLKTKDELHIAECPAMPLIAEVRSNVSKLEGANALTWVKNHWKATVTISIVVLYFLYSAFRVFSVEDIIEFFTK